MDLVAQSTTHPLLDGPTTFRFDPVDAPFRAVSLRYGERGMPAELFPQLLYRYRTITTEQTDWRSWRRDAHTGPEVDFLHSDLLLLPADLTELEVYVATLDYAPADAALLRVYTPRTEGLRTQVRSGDCTQPDFAARLDWCPDGSCTEHPSPAPTTPTHLIVHHSATSNAVTDYDATVRAIWDFHVNTNGWSDIGYNWLVAPDGTIYEGRGDDVIGAHFCGQNSATTGICLLGNYVATAPSAAALEAITQLTAWKLDALSLDATAMSVHAPSGLDLTHISGHRDGCATTCPGDSLYVRLPTLRTEVDTRIANNCGSALAAPSDLDAALDGDLGVRLTWTDNSSGETGFELRRASTVSGPFELLQTVAADTTNYLDTDVQSNQPYFYRVRAVNATDTTAYSNQVFVLTGLVSTYQPTIPNFSLSPNPATTELQLRFADARRREIALVDPLGRIVWKQSSGQAIVRLSLPPLPTGTYFLRVNEVRGTRSRRVVLR